MNQKSRRIFWCFAGVIIIGLGCALFKQSNCGNDAFTALNIRISELTGISLGTVTLAVNCIYLISPLIFGRSYIGIGTLLCALCLGPFTQFFDRAVSSRVMPE